MSNPIITKVVEHLETFPHYLQQQVLYFVQNLKNVLPRGVPGNQLLQFAGSIPQDDLQLMSQCAFHILQKYNPMPLIT